ncbi:hypothetical protein J8Z24_18280 [Pseudoalteromonas sp. SCSIO 43201]|uniref:hypothetical protein n=1 Tax=Pseudoalteromonas sp. SCSIO 43201 TaxID=2822842 RepID=UPI002075C42D|nr:hypothetical protein [Pseudoalteromonas sp. SCSIO 43201]USD30909.1 hypothetical protein J8Z24_18280 [Pseudoalteromonas sp. SCSIO 43201]
MNHMQNIQKEDHEYAFTAFSTFILHHAAEQFPLDVYINNNSKFWTAFSKYSFDHAVDTAINVLEPTLEWLHQENYICLKHASLDFTSIPTVLLNYSITEKGLDAINHKFMLSPSNAQHVLRQDNDEVFLINKEQESFKAPSFASKLFSRDS